MRTFLHVTCFCGRQHHGFWAAHRRVLVSRTISPVVMPDYALLILTLSSPYPHLILTLSSPYLHLILTLFSPKLTQNTPLDRAPIARDLSIS
jgi:hypothetical protein